MTGSDAGQSEREAIWLTDGNGEFHRTTEAKLSERGNALVFDDYRGVETLCGETIDPDEVGEWSTEEPWGKTVGPSCPECQPSSRSGNGGGA